MAEHETTNTRPAPLDLGALRALHGRPLTVIAFDREPPATSLPLAAALFAAGVGLVVARRLARPRG